MILTFDIGNSQTVFGIFRDGLLIGTSRIDTGSKTTADDLKNWISEQMDNHNADPGLVSRSALASVVPAAVPTLTEAIILLTGSSPIIANRDSVGVELAIENPETLGTDRLVEALAIVQRRSYPAIIIDFGTATTFSVVDAAGRFVGGTISPGLQTSADALHRATAKLPALELPTSPIKVPAIGINTEACIRSGILNGTAAMIDGMIDRIEEELGQPAAHIITGGLAGLVAPLCRSQLIRNPYLLLEGLYALASEYRSKK